ncbi:MAG: type II secretion system protein GspF, partial [Armatimonadetes bacterium]|nr:type II secretion system protein GspF [Armatimonadota bacterium]
MSEFRYIALDAQGQQVTGALRADDRRTALSRLKSQGMQPVELELAGAGTPT